MRFVSLFISVFVICSLTYPQEGNRNISSQSTESSAFDLQLLQRIFPGVELSEEIDNSKLKPGRFITGRFKGKLYYLADEFNLLAKDLGKKSTVGVEERLKAYISVLLWIEGWKVDFCAVTSVEVTAVTEIKNGFPFNYRILCSYYKEQNTSRTEEILIWFEQDEILAIHGYIRQTSKTVMPISVRNEYRDADKWFIDQQYSSLNAPYRILGELFPLREFHVIEDSLTSKGKLLVADKPDRRHHRIPKDFNRLFSSWYKNPEATIKKKIEAFLQLYYWFENPDMESIKWDVNSRFQQGNDYQHKVTLNLRAPEGESSSVDVFIATEDHQISGIAEYRGGQLTKSLKLDIMKSEFDQFTVKNEYIDAPLFQRVFPGVTLRQDSTDYFAPDRITAYYNGDEFQLPYEFNVLISAVHGQSGVSLEEMTEAYLRLDQWRADPNVEILYSEPVEFEWEGFNFNHKIAYEGRFGYSLYSNDMLFEIRQGQIVAAVEKNRESPADSPKYGTLESPVLVSSALLGDPEIERSLQHILFSRVFPGVRFRIEETDLTPLQYRIIAEVGDDKLTFPEHYNTLVDRLRNRSQNFGPQEYIESFLRLYYWLEDSDIDIETLKEVHRAKGLYPLNYRAEVMLHGREQKNSMRELLISYDPKIEYARFLVRHPRSVILRIEEYAGGEKINTITPILITDEFDKFLESSTIIEHPTFEKVYPGIEFREEVSTKSPLPRITAWSNSRKLILPQEFNDLYDSTGNKTSASIEDQIDVFIRLFYYPKTVTDIEDAIRIGSDVPDFSDIFTAKITLEDITGVKETDRIRIAMKGDTLVRVDAEDGNALLVLIPELITGKPDIAESKWIKTGEYEARKQRAIDFPLLSSVFPGVVFTMHEYQGGVTGGPIRSISAERDGTKYDIYKHTSIFNKENNALDLLLNDCSTGRIEEKVLAAIWLTFATWIPKTETVWLEKRSNIINGVDYNYRAMIYNLHQLMEIWIKADDEGISLVSRSRIEAQIR